VMSFDPHRGRNCCRTCCENNTHQNDSCLHGLAKRCTTMGECINRDNCLKQFLCLRGAMSGEGRGSNHTGSPRPAHWVLSPILSLLDTSSYNTKPLSGLNSAVRLVSRD
jgi:hypothetical protein